MSATNTAYHSLILHSRPDIANSPHGSYVCHSVLDLSKALADEILKADDPEVITAWMAQKAVYDFWKSAFSSETVREPNVPDPCWYIDAENGGRVVLSLELV